MNNERRRVYYDILTRVGNHGPYQTKSILIFLLISLLGSSTFLLTPIFSIKSLTTVMESAQLRVQIMSVAFPFPKDSNINNQEQ